VDPYSLLAPDGPEAAGSYSQDYIRITADVADAGQANQDMVQEISTGMQWRNPTDVPDITLQRAA
jgi:hypothetical protein